MKRILVLTLSYLLILNTVICSELDLISKVNGLRYHQTGGGEAFVVADDQDITTASILNEIKVTGFTSADNYIAKVTKIGHPTAARYYQGFRDCKNLKSIEIPNTIEYIYSYSFQNCSSLTSIVLDQTPIKKVYQATFSGCSSLKSVSLPNSVTEIEPGAFSGCSSLANINLPQCITLGERAFNNCSSLKVIDLPKCTTLGENAFYSCSSLSKINATSIISIGNNAFSNTSITNVNFPKLTSLGESAFHDCSLLKNVYLTSLKTISSKSFYNCTQLTTIDTPYAETIQTAAFFGCINLSSISINNVELIQPKAFQGCSSLKKISIPSIKTIMTSAFQDCSSLISVNGIEKVQSINANTFTNCISLQSIELDEVQTIGSGAFSGCINLQKVTLGKNCKSTATNVFDNCPNIATIYSLSPDCDGKFATTLPSTTIIYAHPKSVKRIQALTEAQVYGIIADDFYISEEHISYSLYKMKVSGINNKDLTNLKISHPVTSETINIDDGVCIIENLAPNKEYKINIHNTKSDVFYEHTIKTLKATVSISDISIYMGLITAKGIASSDEYSKPNEIGVFFGNNNRGVHIVKGTPENIEIKGLLPGESIKVAPYAIYGTDTIKGEYISCTTKTPNIAIKQISETQTTTTLHVSVSNDSTVQIYDITINDSPVNKNGNITVQGLIPAKKYTFIAKIYYNEEFYLNKSASFQTLGLNPQIDLGEVTPTTCEFKGTFNIVDANLKEAYFSFLGEELQTGDYNFQGLDPSTKYTIEYYVKTKEGSNEKVTRTFTTPALEMTTLNPKVVSNSCAIVAATTNMSDEETNAGFQWRKYEAPETLPSSEGYAAIYDGQLEGYIKNLQATSFYNVRAFYKSTAGKYYYSDWVTFDPSDFSYFEPTVHTYRTEELTANSAKVKGYVLQGTDAITEQGFVYWPTGTNKANATRNVTVPENASIVIAKGQVMNATLEGLTPSTTYNFCAFVTTASGTIYGEEHSFTTKADETGIELLESEQPTPSIIGYYDLNGRKLSEPQHGITIVRYSDGTARKILTE